MPSRLVDSSVQASTGQIIGAGSNTLYPQHFAVSLQGFSSAIASDFVIASATGHPLLSTRQIGRCATATQSVVSSLIWGFDPIGGNITTGSLPSSSSGRSVVLLVDGPAVSQNASIAATMVSVTGISAVAETPTIIPAIGDLLVAFAFWNAATSPSSVVDNPGGSNGMAGSNNTTTGFCLAYAYRLSASAAVPHKRTFNLSASQTWGAGILAITSTPNTLITTTKLYKGRVTSTLDAPTDTGSIVGTP